MMNRAVITTNDFFIADALELIEDDEVDQTIFVNEAAVSEEDEPMDKAATVAQESFVENYELQTPLWDFETITDWSKRIANYTDE